jgi:hypothetical protein
MHNEAMTSPRRGACRARRAAAIAGAAIAALTLTGINASAEPGRAQPPRLSGHALLVNVPGLRVYGPANAARTACPHLLPLPAHALSTVKRAVALAMPAFERRVHLNGRDPRVTVGPTATSGFSSVAGGCGRADWERSIFASVYLPHVAGASLSQHRFAVGRVQQGWVIWGYIH